MRKLTIGIFILLTVLLEQSCKENSSPSEGIGLVGAWKGKVQFKSGAFASVKDFEFMYVFNEGGTMTESSNYDGAPPVPPAYGIWRKTGDREFESRYEFFFTRVPKSFDDITASGGFSPAGYGILRETITLSQDGQSFRSIIKYDAFDLAGNQIESGSEAETEAKRMSF
ncbi:MAG: hypothetical protein A2V93_01600 [Ignavibacteria bacterium RBG_16_34_14]|nr:MAG: hypothetical protein A2V93_01600 [Ignavibacteria bacterium RBG_16_34_14]